MNTSALQEIAQMIREAADELARENDYYESQEEEEEREQMEMTVFEEMWDEAISSGNALLHLDRERLVVTKCYALLADALRKLSLYDKSFSSDSKMEKDVWLAMLLLYEGMRDKCAIAMNEAIEEEAGKRLALARSKHHD